MLHTLTPNIQSHTKPSSHRPRSTRPNNQDPILPSNPVLQVNPKYYKMLIEILYNFSDPILKYLSLTDLSTARIISKLFKSLIDDYYRNRLVLEMQYITEFNRINSEKVSKFMRFIDTQIPLSTGNWLNFDIATVISTIKTSLSKETITNIKSIKNIGKLSQNVYAPFCIIFGYNKTNNYFVKNDNWKKTATKILSDPNFLIKISNLDYENFDDNEILEAFVILNLNELSIDKVRKYSPDLEKMVKWCQAVVSYHLLVHPYVYRNYHSEIKENTDVFNCAMELNYRVNKFYRFKRFLNKLGVVRIPLGDYIFNLIHSRNNERVVYNYDAALNEKNIGLILSYLPYKQSVKFIKVNKKFYCGFKYSVFVKSCEGFKDMIYYMEKNYKKLTELCPVIYKKNMLSKYFLMLDDILNSEIKWTDGINYVPFLSKDQLNDLKNIKINNATTNKIAKILCILLNEKPERKRDDRYELDLQYIKKLNKLALSTSLSKLMRSCDKLSLSDQQINALLHDIKGFYSLEKLDEISKLNKGIYQVLIWELFVYEYQKELNPLLNSNLEMNISNAENIEIVSMYRQLIKNLKNNLKVFYHFNSLSIDNKKMPKCEMVKILRELEKYYAKIGDLNYESIFLLHNTEHEKVADIYFENKDRFPIGTRPLFYSKIMTEIININLNITSKNNLNVDQGNEYMPNDNLGTIKEETDNVVNNNSNNAYGNNYNTNTNTESSRNSNKLDRNNQNLALQKSSSPSKSKKITFNSIPDDIIITSLLFYLDINSLPLLARTNKKFNFCIKTHSILRSIYLSNIIKEIEDDNNENNQFASIESKRNKYFSEYEIEKPEISHANRLIRMLSPDDIAQLRIYYRKKNKNCDQIIAPFVVLFGEKPKGEFNIIGDRLNSYYEPGMKLLNDRKIIKKIQNFNFDMIPNKTFSAAEKLTMVPLFGKDKIKGLSGYLSHLIYWILGTIEYHRAERKYALSYYDFGILDKEEIRFCLIMDNYEVEKKKIDFYCNRFCKKYEGFAKKYVNEVEQEEEEGENNDEEKNEDENFQNN